MGRFQSPYTSHDFTTSDDIKIIKMEGKLGIVSYAVFWKLIEKLGIANDYELEYDLKVLSHMTRVKQRRFSKKNYRLIKFLYGHK